MADPEKIFQEALAALEQGERKQAREKLTGLARSNPKNPDYWIYLSAAADTQAEKIFCLENALKADPANPIARRGLAALNGRSGSEQVLPVPPPKRKYTVDTLDEGEGGKSQNLLLTIWRTPNLRWTVLGAVAVIVLLMIASSFSRRINPIAIYRITLTPATATATNTATTTPTVTLTPRGTPPTATPTLLGPTPLAVFLGATYTPTPRYINTPHPILESYRISMRNLESGNLAQMLTYIEQASREDPNSPDLLFYLGEARRLSGLYEDALKAYEAAITANSRFAPAYLGSALAKMALDPQADVLEELNLAVENDPAYADAYRARAQYWISQQDSEAAFADAETLASISPTDPWVPLLRAQALLGQNEPEQALEQALLAYEADITLLPVYLTLAQAYLKLDEPEKALAYGETYVLYKPEEPIIWLLIGEARFKANRPGAALQALDKALELGQSSLQVYIYRGYIFLDQGEAKKAVNEFINAYQLDDRSFDANLGLGRAMFADERLNDAYQQLIAAENMATTDLHRAEVLYWRAQVLEKAGNLRVAILDYQALLALPTDQVPANFIRFARERLSILITATPSPTGGITPSSTARLTGTVPAGTPTPKAGTSSPGSLPLTATPTPKN